MWVTGQASVFRYLRACGHSHVPVCLCACTHTRRHGVHVCACTRHMSVRVHLGVMCVGAGVHVCAHCVHLGVSGTFPNQALGREIAQGP